MLAVLQRVSHARVRVGGTTIGAVGRGFMVLAGAIAGDTLDDVGYIAKRVATLRVFPDDDGRMNRSLMDVGGGVLLVSQFTLAADTRKGRRPSFIRALRPEEAEPLIDVLADQLRAQGIVTETGQFGADMQVELVNDGPVTILLDSRETRRGNLRASAEPES